MGVVCHRQMITTDASLSGWGAVFEGKPACGVWSGKYLALHINGLGSRVVHLALIHFLPFLAHSHVIFRMDNMAVVSHINHQGGFRSRTLNRHASSLGTRQIFVPESGPCPKGPVPSGGLSVETETQVGGMDA